MKWRTMIVSGLLVTLGACGRGGGADAPSLQQAKGDAAMTLEEAAARLRDFVDRTATQAMPAVAAHARPLGTGREVCDEGETGREHEAYSIGLPVQPQEVEGALKRIREYWEGLGHQVEARGELNPALYILFDDFGVGARINREDRELSIGGSTPCLPVPTDSDGGDEPN